MSLSHQQNEGYVLYKELLGEGENGSTTLMRGARGKMGGGEGEQRCEAFEGLCAGGGGCQAVDGLFVEIPYWQNV